MRWLRLAVFALASVAPATAAAVEVKIPDEGWSISFDAPPLSEKREARKSGHYAFSAGAGRFNVSVFVEAPRGPGGGHRDVYRYYWPRASQNPMVAKDTVTESETDRYVRVRYDVAAKAGSTSIRQRNVNYYFAFRGKWIDVHVSVVEPTAADDQLCAAFDASFKYGP